MFYRLTPRQFSLLNEAHRKRIAHKEMIQAFTTAAIVNYAFSPPKDPVQPAMFMPNYLGHESDAVEPSTSVRKYTGDEIIDWQARVANLVHELKQGNGPMLDEIRSRSDG